MSRTKLQQNPIESIPTSPWSTSENLIDESNVMALLEELAILTYRIANPNQISLATTEQMFELFDRWQQQGPPE